jgi:hypothetical protein
MRAERNWHDMNNFRKFWDFLPNASQAAIISHIEKLERATAANRTALEIQLAATLDSAQQLFNSSTQLVPARRRSRRSKR